MITWKEDLSIYLSIPLSRPSAAAGEVGPGPEHPVSRAGTGSKHGPVPGTAGSANESPPWTDPANYSLIGSSYV